QVAEAPRTRRMYRERPCRSARTYNIEVTSVEWTLDDLQVSRDLPRYGAVFRDHNDESVPGRTRVDVNRPPLPDQPLSVPFPSVGNRSLEWRAVGQLPARCAAQRVT